MKRFLKSLNFALRGIAISLKQRNFKIQLFVAFMVVLSGLFFQISATEWCMLFLCISLVLSLEMTNTALEHLVDLVSPDYHKSAEIIKDVAAGAVLVSALLSLIIGFIIFGKYITALI